MKTLSFYCWTNTTLNGVTLGVALIKSHDRNMFTFFKHCPNKKKKKSWKLFSVEVEKNSFCFFLRKQKHEKYETLCNVGTNEWKYFGGYRKKVLK